MYSSIKKRSYSWKGLAQGLIPEKNLKSQTSPTVVIKKITKVTSPAAFVQRDFNYIYLNSQVKNKRAKWPFIYSFTSFVVNDWSSQQDLLIYINKVPQTVH